MDDEERTKLVKDVQEGMAFAVPFIKALAKLRDAEITGKGALLTHDETKAIMDGFRMLKESIRPS